MDLDLETFLVVLYVIVDDLSQSDIAPRLPACGGPAAQMSDSEVLCLGLAAQWRSGVPWTSERGLLRYVRKHLRALFPSVLSQSAFNQRLRRVREVSPAVRGQEQAMQTDAAERSQSGMIRLANSDSYGFPLLSHPLHLLSSPPDNLRNSM